MPLFFMEKAAAIGDEQLKVSKLGAVDSRVVDFGNDAVPDRKPNPARRRISRADSVFASMRPAR